MSRIDQVGDRYFDHATGAEIRFDPPVPDDGQFARALAEACDRELLGVREPVECSACGSAHCAGWCRRHPGHVSEGDRE